MGGVVKSVSKTLFGNSGSGGNTPTSSGVYDYIEARKSALPNIQSSLGSRELDPGSNTVTFTDSAQDVQRNNIASGMLASMVDENGNFNPQQYQDAYYDYATRLLEPQWEKAQADLDRNLINRGIQIGNNQYSTATSDLLNSQDATREAIANQSILNAGNLRNSDISGLNALTGGRDINALLGIQGYGSDAYNNAFNSNLAQNQVNARQTSGLFGGLGNMIGGLLGYN
jgi:hypothetical protein